LIEMLMAAATGGMVLSALGVTMVYSARTCAAIANYVDLDMHSRNAVDRMTRDIRQADSLVSFSATNWTFLAVDPTSGSTNSLAYIYDPNAQTLTRSYVGANDVLLTKILPNSLSLSMYQRNPIGGAVDGYTTTNPALCKVVQVCWTCFRSNLGASDTEAFQSTKITIRKE
jgi:hypothetical protein